MSRFSSALTLGAALLGLFSVQCGAYLGPNALVPTNGGKALVGATGGLHLYPDGSHGFIASAEATVAPPQGDGRKFRGWLGVPLGYAVMPLPYISRLGVEVGVGPAGGVLPDAIGYPFSMGWTWRLAAPFRVSPTMRPWECGDQTGLYYMLSPSVEVVQLIPLTQNHPHDVVTTLVFGLDFTFDAWVAVEP